MVSRSGFTLCLHAFRSRGVNGDEMIPQFPTPARLFEPKGRDWCEACVFVLLKVSGRYTLALSSCTVLHYAYNST